MKARVKATGEIVEVRGIYTPTIRTFGMEEIESYDMEAVEIVTDPDYWTRLEHQYAGMAMQAMVSNSHNTDYHKDWSNGYGRWTKYDNKELAEMAVYYATALVQKLKGKEERK